MTKINHRIFIVVAVIASLTSTFTLWLLEYSLNYLFYILEILLILILYVIMKGVDFKVVGSAGQLRNISRVAPDIVLTAFSIVYILNILGAWGVDSTLQLIVTLMFTSFLPGYALLNLISSRGQFSILELVVFSYALSYFLTAFLTFVFSLLIGVEPWALGICIAYVGLGLLSAFKHIRGIRTLSPAQICESERFPRHKYTGEVTKHSAATPTRSSFSRFVDYFAIHIIILFFIMVVAGIFPRFSFLPNTDISRHHMWSRTLVRASDVYLSKYMYLWFHLFLASFYQLSGVSFPMVQSVLMVLNIMPILAFYIMAKEHLEKVDKRLPILSTVFFSLFSGLAWTYVVKLKLYSSGLPVVDLLSIAGDKTYRGTIYASVLGITGHTPILVSFTLFFAMLHLLKRKDLPPRAYFILFALLFASSYLTHVTEAAFLAVALSLYMLIMRGKSQETRKTLLPIFYGFVMVGLILLTLPFLINFVFRPSLIFSFAVPICLIVLSYFLSKRLKAKFVFGKKVKRATLPITLTLLFLCVLSLTVWLSIAEGFQMAYVDEAGIVPWFFYPLLLGVTGILAIAGTYCFLSEPKYSSLRLFVFMVLMAFVVGKIVSIVNVEFFWVGEWEKRFVPFIVISSAILASVGFTKIVSYKHGGTFHGYQGNLRKEILASLFISMVVVGGVSSNMLASEYWRLVISMERFFPTTDELEALSFLDKTFEEKTHSMVITVTSTSYEMLAFSAPPYRLYKNFVIHSARNPDIALNVLSFSPMFSHKYIYLHNRDLVYLRGKFGGTYFTQHMLPNLSPIFNNSEVSIYEVPQLFSPLIEADMALILPFYQSALTNDYLYSYDILALQNYTVMFDLDDKIMKKRILLLPFDPPNKDMVNDDGLVLPPDSEDYMEYVRSGGKLVILNTNGYGFFADTLFMRSNATLSTSKIVGNGEFLIPNIRVPIVQVSDRVKALSYYVNSTGGSVPFSMYKAVDNGMIFYLNVYPFIQTQSDTNAKRGATYSSLGRILNVARVDVQSSSHDGQAKMNIQATFREADLTGSVSVSATSILPLRLDGNALNVTVDGETSVVSNVSSLVLSNYDTVAIDAEYAKISNGKGLYATITVNGTIKITLSGNNMSSMAKVISENEEQETLLGGSSTQIILLTNKALDLYVRVPHIEVIGESLFKEMYFDDPMLNWRMRTYGQNLAIRGLTKFAICCGDTYTLAGDFSLEGSFERDPPILRWNEWSTLSKATFYGLLMLPIYLGAIFLSDRRNLRIKNGRKQNARTFKTVCLTRHDNFVTRCRS